MKRAGVAVVVMLTSVAMAAGATSAAGAVVAHAAAVGPAPAAQPLQLVFPLAADIGGLKRFALSIATPGSPDYAQYESIARLSRRFGASPATRARVLSYLRGAGGRHVKIDPTGMFADATMSVALAERIFGTQLARFRSQDGTKFVAPSAATAATASARVPAALRGAVRSVIGLDTRPLASRAVAKRSAHVATAGVPSELMRTGTPGGCGAAQATGGFTPNQYLSAYDYLPLRNANVSGQGVRVALIEIDGFKDGDINAFANCFGLGVPALNAYGVGVSRPLAPGGEATLDLEVLDAAAPGLKAIDVYESTPSAANTLQAMTAPLGNAGHQPQVVSASLGLCEPDVVGAISQSGLDNAEASLAEASAAGITYLASSGDQGSADCTDQNNNPTHRLAVNYPASSWWVTGVGGTNFALNSTNQMTGQIVWNDGVDQPGSAGGGGLSQRFVRPNYQTGSESANRRAVPDVAMLSDVAPGYAIYCSAAPPQCDPSAPWTTVGGTSAATPLLAGGFALVDQQLRAARRAQLGLVNPLLYALGRSSSAASVFSDVAVGSNDVWGPVGGLNGSALGCCSAAPGYDTASGWGSVNVANFAAAALAHQPPTVSVSARLPGHQHPLSSRQIKIKVSCSNACVLGAYALIKAGRNSYEVDSKLSQLGAAGSATVVLKLSGKLLGKLRSARSHHNSINASVYGVVFDRTVYGVIGDPAESIQTQTGARHLKIA
jgi:subtilase family serine protease